MEVSVAASQVAEEVAALGKRHKCIEKIIIEIGKIM